MGNFDEVLARIQNQLETIKKSFETRRSDYRAALSGQEHAGSPPRV